MNPLRIKGVTGFANRVRRELSAPISHFRKSTLRGEVEDVIRQVDRIVAEHRTCIEHLPAPTRRALQFLATLDLDVAVATSTAGGPAPSHRPPTAAIRVVGIRSTWRTIIGRLARSAQAGGCDEIHRAIRSSSQRVERQLTDRGWGVEDLTALSGKIRGWLAYFSNRRNFDMYCAAIERASRPWNETLRRSGRFRPLSLLEFHPVSGLYTLRGSHDGTRVILPTPMIMFSSALFARLADAALVGGDKQSVMRATLSDEYQSIAAELDALCGTAECPAGVHHDLGESFDRVNAVYFGGSAARPRLSWSRTFSGRKFGHYDVIGNTVMISCTLDRSDLPEFVLDFVMYHELLHKEMGIAWRNGRALAHTRVFRKRERRFERYAAADAMLQRLVDENG